MELDQEEWAASDFALWFKTATASFLSSPLLWAATMDIFADLASEMSEGRLRHTQLRGVDEDAHPNRDQLYRVTQRHRGRLQRSFWYTPHVTVAVLAR